MRDYPLSKNMYTLWHVPGLVEMHQVSLRCTMPDRTGASRHTIGGGVQYIQRVPLLREGLSTFKKHVHQATCTTFGGSLSGIAEVCDARQNDWSFKTFKRWWKVGNHPLIRVDCTRPWGVAWEEFLFTIKKKYIVIIMTNIKATLAKKIIFLK